MSGFDYNNNPDHILDNPWATVASGTDSWQDDYTRFRTDLTSYSGTTYSGITDMSKHSAGSAPTDVYIGRTKTGRELDKNKY
jgi:hypothetical protein